MSQCIVWLEDAIEVSSGESTELKFFTIIAGNLVSRVGDKTIIALSDGSQMEITGGVVVTNPDTVDGVAAFVGDVEGFHDARF